MRLSSISLIAATLAAIAGSVIAAPRPLHARALEGINSLSECDVDVYSCESGLVLLERKEDNKAQEAANAAREAANAAREAARKAQLISDWDQNHRYPMSRQAQHHRKEAKEYGGQASLHQRQAQASLHQRQAQASLHQRQAQASLRQRQAQPEASLHQRQADHPGRWTHPSNEVLDGAITRYNDATAVTRAAIANYDCHPVVEKDNKDRAAGTLLYISRGGHCG